MRNRSASAVRASIPRWVLLLVGCLLTTTGLALARPGADVCQPALASWIGRCARQSGLTLQARSCPQGRVVVAVQPRAAARFDVEVRVRPEGAFRSVAGFGVSPVGEFPDWSKEPEARRAALDAFEACIRKDPSVPLEGDVPTLAGPRHPAFNDATPRRPVPWILLAAMLATAAFWWTRRRKGDRCVRSDAAPRRSLAALVALVVACFAFRWLVLPRGFFHQNGQGPLWIRQAVGDASAVSDYGPGYAEVFGWLVRAVPSEPDRAVFLALAMLSATVPAMVWGIARRSGAYPVAAWGVAVLVAIHPLSGRLAQSESYFGVGVWLLFAAGWVLSTAGVRSRSRGLSFWFGVLACGLLLAQAVRVHPVMWAPACAIPGVLIVQPGPWRRRLLQTLLATGGVVAVVAVTSGRVLSFVLAGLRSHPLRPVEHLAFESPGVGWWAGLIVLAAAVCASRARARAAFALAVLVLGFASIRATDVLGANHPVVSHAYVLLWAPPLLAAALSLVGATVRRIPRFRSLVQLLLVSFAGVLATAPWWSAYTRVATDLREQTWAMEWRRTIEPASVVTYLGRAGDRLLVLPIQVAGHHEHLLRTGELPPPLPGTGVSSYYYRSSLCSTREGEEACAAFERALPLTVLEERDLPALGSHPWQPLGPDPVRVGLYRIGPLP